MKTNQAVVVTLQNVKKLNPTEEIFKGKVSQTNLFNIIG